MSERGLISGLDRTGREPGSVVAWRAGRALTWSEWHSDVVEAERVVTNRAVARWALYCEDAYEFSVWLMALLRCGCVPVLLPDTAPGTVEKATEWTDALLGDIAGVPSFPAPVSNAAESDRRVAPDAQLELFTSGSTGHPKLVRKTVRQLEAELEVLATLWERLGECETFVATVSHQHIYGLLFRLLLPLVTGRTFLARSCQSPSAVVREAAAHDGVAWIASPAQLKRLDPGVAGPCSNALRAIVSSGGVLEAFPADVVATWAGVPVIEVYGSTESGGVAWRQQHKVSGTAPWSPFPNVSLETGVGDVLRVRSVQAAAPDWLEMSDRVHLHADGRFDLLGRVDRIVKIEEVRVSLEGLERRLCEHELVAEAACVLVGVGGGRNRDLVGAVIVPTDAGAERLASSARRAVIVALRDWLAEHFDRVTLPRRWRFIEAMPLTAQGKVPLAALAEHFETGDSLHARLLSETSPSANEVWLDLELQGDLAWFEGHFPDAPVLPGVVQVLWATQYGTEKLGFGGSVRCMRKVKFLRLLRPGARVRLNLVYDPERSELTFCYLMDDERCSSGVLVGS